MKLSIIIPAVDVPIGSGRVGYWLKNSLQSVLEGGHEDFECFVGCDGDIESIRATVSSFNDDRFRYIAFPETHTWGNYQRNRIMREYATGDYTTFMDHDDSYTKNALREMASDAMSFPGRAFFYRVELRAGVIVWMSRDIKQPRNVAGHGVVAPHRMGYPIWGDSADRLEDLYYYRAVHQHALQRNQPVIWAETVVAKVRPWSPPELISWKGPLEEAMQVT